ncbi:MAG: putative RNA uridine N3 methyltransferase [Candidatus Nezhaarchaeales archaeon]
MKIAVALPSTLVAEANSLLEKTMKIGFIARVLSIFKVEKVIIYLDRSTELDERNLISKLFNYILCPQYLRKKVFPLDPDLRYVGVMPPLNTPNHPLEKSVNELPNISYREGLVIGRRRQNRYIVDVGLEKPIVIREKRALQHGERVILKLIKKEGNIKARLIEKKDVPHYFGFDVMVTDMSLKEIIASFKNEMLTVATSRYGKEVHKEVHNLMRKMRLHNNKVLLLFGSPFKGLYEIAKVEGFDLDEAVDFTLNFIPEQGTKTVRTEEALCSVLAILNFLHRAYSEMR